MESLLEFSRKNKKFIQFVPSITYIIGSLVILYFGGPWYISAGGWDIYYGPVIITIAMLIGAIIYMKKASNVYFQPIQERKEDGVILALKILLYFVLANILRQLMIWKYYNPWEKLPLAFMVIFQVTLVENLSLDDIGMKDWNMKNIGLSFILAGMEIVLSTVGMILLYMLLFENTVLGLMYPCVDCQLYWISFPYQFLAVGFAEEFFFRGYIYTKLRIYFKKLKGDRYSYIMTMIITNLLFGLFHVPWYVEFNSGVLSIDLLPCLRRVISTGAMGFFFSYLYEKTGSLATPMLAHGFGNSINDIFRFTYSPSLMDPFYAILYWKYVIVQLGSMVAMMLIVRAISKRWYTDETLQPWK